MNNLQWTILFLVAFAAIGMIWFAKTFIPSIEIGPKVVFTPASSPDANQTPASTGPRVVIVGTKSNIVPVYKENYTPIHKLEASKISSYRIQGGRKVLVFSDGSETFLTDEEYKQLPAGVRFRFEYTQGQP